MDFEDLDFLEVFGFTNDNALLDTVSQSLAIRRHSEMGTTRSLDTRIRREYLKKLRTRGLHY